MESFTTKQELEYNFDPLEVRQLVDWSRCHTGLPFLARAEGFVLRCNPCKTFSLIDRPWGTKLTAEIDLAAFRMHWNNNNKNDWKRKQLIYSSGSTGIQMSWIKHRLLFPRHAEGTPAILPSPDLVEVLKREGRLIWRRSLPLPLYSITVGETCTTSSQAVKCSANRSLFSSTTSSRHKEKNKTINNESSQHRKQHSIQIVQEIQWEINKITKQI